MGMDALGLDLSIIALALRSSALGRDGLSMSCLARLTYKHSKATRRAGCKGIANTTATLNFNPNSELMNYPSQIATFRRSIMDPSNKNIQHLTFIAEHLQNSPDQEERLLAGCLFALMGDAFMGRLPQALSLMAARSSESLKDIAAMRAEMTDR
jgi:hypothetical protein